MKIHHSNMMFFQERFRSAMVAGGWLIILISGCADLEAETRRLRQEVETRARADAARKEMDALPKAFKSPPFFRVNELENTSNPAPAAKKTNS